MNFQEFCRYLNRIKYIFEFEDKIHNLGMNVPCDLGEFDVRFPSLVDDVVELLEIIFDDTEMMWINYYVFEKRFGEDYKDGDVSIDGKDIPLRTYEDLWNILMEGKGE